MPKGIRKTADIAPLGVRMPPEIKNALTHAAHVNGRSLNAEIVLRLRESLEEGRAVSSSLASEPVLEVYSTGRKPLSELEEAMLDAFNKLPTEKRWALISLISLFK